MRELAADRLGSTFDEGAIKSFLSDREPRADKALLNVYHCLSHGDLHGRNILVDRGKRLHLVDAGSIGELPWPSDISRLFVDLIVSGWDAGSRSHEWDGISAWIERIEALMSKNYVAEEVTDSNRGVWLALLWIRKNIGSMHPESFTPQSEYEFLLSTCVEFLRASYRSADLAAPKRVLGLAAFCVVRKRAEEILGAIRR